MFNILDSCDAITPSTYWIHKRRKNWQTTVIRFEEHKIGSAKEENKKTVPVHVWHSKKLKAHRNFGLCRVEWRHFLIWSQSDCAPPRGIYKTYWPGWLRGVYIYKTYWPGWLRGVYIKHIGLADWPKWFPNAAVRIPLVGAKQTWIQILWNNFCLTWSSCLAWLCPGQRAEHSTAFEPADTAHEVSTRDRYTGYWFCWISGRPERREYLEIILTIACGIWISMRKKTRIHQKDMRIRKDSTSNFFFFSKI